MARSQTVATFYRDIERAVKKGKREALKAGAQVLYRATLEELAAGSPGKGKTYLRGKKRKKGARVTHRASVAGAAPARDTGTLIRSVGMEIRDSEAAVGVKRSAPYAKYLDPPDGQKAPRFGRRPFLSSAFRKKQKEIRTAITESLEKTLRGVGR